LSHERVGVDAEFSDNERHAPAHQAENEMDIAGQAIEHGNGECAVAPVAGAVLTGVPKAILKAGRCTHQH
jgi:hypothetical protein